jgi:hypothetical protein
LSRAPNSALVPAKSTAIRHCANSTQSELKSQQKQNDEPAAPGAVRFMPHLHTGAGC